MPAPLGWNWDDQGADKVAGRGLKGGARGSESFPKHHQLAT